jgi:hypothetical protein
MGATALEALSSEGEESDEMDCLDGRSTRVSLMADCAVDALSNPISTISPSEADDGVGDLAEAMVAREAEILGTTDNGLPALWVIIAC